jgi:hypothetical protein
MGKSVPSAFKAAIHTSTSSPSVSGLKKTPTAKIPSPHSLAAILSPSAPPEESTTGASRSSTPKRTHAEAFSSGDQPYLHPASPTQNQASVASTGEPSPGTRGEDDGSVGGMRGGQEEKKAPPKMVRSSIACSRCRRSKVKCELYRAICPFTTPEPNGIYTIK